MENLLLCMSGAGMIFHEADFDRMELRNAAELSSLIVEHFCTKPMPELSEEDMRLVEKLRAKAAVEGLNYEQFNELLLLLRQNLVSRAFFDFFFRKPTITLEDLKAGITTFRGWAMLRYGNLVFARGMLSTLDDQKKIASTLGGLGRPTTVSEDDLKRRPFPLLNIDPISREDTWLTGNLTGEVVQNEIRELTRMLKGDANLPNRPLFVRLGRDLAKLDERTKAAQEIALRNSEVYLTWDYLDVYVATSMRNKWEFEDTFDFVQEVFSNELLLPLKVRYFDPTQCMCRNARDKGLLEGLMLNRAACTIYMVQESDTFGKDSELAATLGQGKPVVAYVPGHIPEVYAARIRDYPLEFLKMRLLMLDAEGILDDTKCIERLSAVDGRFEETINRFLRAFEDHRRAQPLSLGSELDQQLFKDRYPDYDRPCHLLAEAECFNFDKRSRLLDGRHPLSMQVNVSTGTANGVLVVRSAAACARLIHGVLTSQLELEIADEKDNNGCVVSKVLKERISGSAFRVVTHNERLTNSFWNLWGR